MNDTLVSSGDVRLAAHLARPLASAATRRFPGLVLLHGFPPGAPLRASATGQTYPQLADRIAADVGWIVLTFNFRGTGESAGDFSITGWQDDIRAAIAHLRAMDEVTGVWLAGASTGGSLAICVGADDPDVRGVAALAAPSEFDGWAADGRQFAEHCRSLGLIRSSDFPPDVSAWARDIRECRPLSAVSRIPPRPLLIVQGDEDDAVSTWDARALVDAAGGHAELRIISGAGHRLRHDPRAIAILLGWLERHT
jgi:fermentation-respiration switch protein FrsA (DUF1100 family)